MAQRTIEYFEVKHGDSGVIGKNSHYAFDTHQEAKDMALEFKANPRSHNEKMEDSNVQYWKNQNYTIVKKTIVTEELETI